MRSSVVAPSGAAHPPRRDDQQSVRHEDGGSRDIRRDRGGPDGRRRPGRRDSKIVHTNAAATAMLEAGDPIVTRWPDRGSIRDDHHLIAIGGRTGREGRGGTRPERHRHPDPSRKRRPARHPRSAAADAATCATGLIQTRRRRPVRDVSLRTAAIPHVALNQLYDLTPAEIRIFELICDGHTRDAISGLLGVSVSTVEAPPASCVREDRLPPPGRPGQAREVSDVSGVRRALRPLRTSISRAARARRSSRPDCRVAREGSLRAPDMPALARQTPRLGPLPRECRC